ncbi:MAG: hydrogenase maturation protease [Verrucomicrobiae bacterium]|nr:hydrogenase maturation protease [Verrucomicrobiae bacterium]
MREKLKGRVCFLGIGNEDLGDDGFGPALVRRLETAGCMAVDGGMTPENALPRLASRNCDQVVMVDAVRAGAAPGSVVFMDAAEINSRFAQITTHKLSLGLLSRLIEDRTRAKVWLLGVQPLSVERNAGLSREVRDSLDALEKIVLDAKDNDNVLNLS